jgi:hypothetical protein
MLVDAELVHEPLESGPLRALSRERKANPRVRRTAAARRIVA